MSKLPFAEFVTYSYTACYTKDGDHGSSRQTQRHLLLPLPHSQRTNQLLQKNRVLEITPNIGSQDCDPQMCQNPNRFSTADAKNGKPIPTVKEMLEQELREASIAAIEAGTYWENWQAPDPQPELELSQDEIEAIDAQNTPFTPHFEKLDARREGMEFMAAAQEEEQRRAAAQSTSNQLVSDLVKTLKSVEINIKQDGRLSKICEMYIEGKTLSGLGVAQITSLKEVIYGILTRFFGEDADCLDITDERVHELFTLIQQLPQKFTLTPNWKTEIDHARKQEGTLSFTTVKRKWLTVLEIFSSNFALNFFKCSPFEGVRFKKNDKRNKQKKTYKLFNDTKLVALFAPNHLKFNAKRPAQYWMPLIGLYAG